MSRTKKDFANSEEYRKMREDVIELYTVGDIKMAEISRRLNVTLNTVCQLSPKCIETMG